MKLGMFTVLVLLLFSFTQELGRSNNTFGLIDSLVQKESTDNHFNGTIIIGNTNEILYQVAIGTANRSWDIPLEMDSRFDICSINKSFIAVLVLLAVEEGKLQLTDKLIDYLKPQPILGFFSPDITLHHLLTHTSGIPHYNAVDSTLSKDNFKEFKRLHYSNQEYVDFISQLKPENTSPGEGFNYSSFGYFLLSAILERTYQKPFSSILEEKICVPLNLDHTICLTSNEAVYSKIVEGYNMDSNDQWNRNQFLDFSLGKRIYSSSIDLFKWGNAIYDTTFLSASSRELMLTNHLEDITPNLSYGYGWVVFDGIGGYEMGNLGIDKKYIIHGGNTEGFKSMLVNINKGEYIIAFLSNSGDQTNEIRIAKNIAQILTQ